MIFRETTIDDIPAIIDIFNQAKAYLKSQNIPQWQDGYPDETSIIDDISQNIAYVLCEDNKVIATSALSFDGEPTYKTIYEGNWLTNTPYAVVHRIAVTGEQKGKNIAKILLTHCEELCNKKQVASIRVDTHQENLSMKNFLIKNGFKQCGIILLSDNAERIAFEKILYL